MKQKITTKLVISIPPFHKSTIISKLDEEGVEFLSIYDVFKEIISSAKESIKICSPFFEPNYLTELQNLLIRKAAEDVKIKIITRELCNTTDGTSRKKSVKRFIERLNTEKLKDNIKVRNYHFEGQNKNVLSSVHSKFVISDDKKLYLGSGEFRRNSFERNFEMGIITNDFVLIKNANILFDSFFNIGVLIKNEESK